MSSGVVYLRPILVGRVRAFGPRGEAARMAWQRLSEWAEPAGIRGLPIRGFGLVHMESSAQKEKTSAYDACLEIVEGIKPDPDAGVVRTYIPGGAYLRRRHREPIEAMAQGFRDLLSAEIKRRGLAFDRDRPMIEIYHEDHTWSGDKPRIDLCVPVRA